jgi:hypothetical protein
MRCIWQISRTQHLGIVKILFELEDFWTEFGEFIQKILQRILKKMIYPK